MRACFQFPECSISYTKILQGESNGKEGKRCFTALDTAEPKHILYKDIANERKESLLSISRVQHILIQRYEINPSRYLFLTLKNLNNTY